MTDRVVVVCGSRYWSDGDRIELRLAALDQRTVVVHGGAAGADRLAGIAARRMGLHTAVVQALWDRYGKRAGHVRNSAMLDLGPERVIAFWDESSPGTKGMIEAARRRGIPVEVIAA